MKYWIVAEILLFPWVGVLAAEVLHKPSTELLFVGGFFILYVSLRLWARRFWQRAASLAAAIS